MCDVVGINYVIVTFQPFCYDSEIEFDILYYLLKNGFAFPLNDGFMSDFKTVTHCMSFKIFHKDAVAHVILRRIHVRHQKDFFIHVEQVE